MNGDHTPAGPLRGGKYSLYEGGTRVPFITWWKGHIEPGISGAVVSQVDLLSSLASLVGSSERGPDSQDLMEVLLGHHDSGRRELIQEAMTRTAMRRGKWKLIPPYKGQAILNDVKIESGNNPHYQLFNLNTDPGEHDNLSVTEEDTLKELVTLYELLRGTEPEAIKEIELK
jgi:arylsulfatase A-like enzyme